MGVEDVEGRRFGVEDLGFRVRRVRGLAPLGLSTGAYRINNFTF